MVYAIMDEEWSATNILLIAGVTSELVHYISTFLRWQNPRALRDIRCFLKPFFAQNNSKGLCNNYLEGGF